MAYKVIRSLVTAFRIHTIGQYKVSTHGDTVPGHCFSEYIPFPLTSLPLGTNTSDHVSDGYVLKGLGGATWASPDCI